MPLGERGEHVQGLDKGTLEFSGQTHKFFLIPASYLWCDLSFFLKLIITSWWSSGFDAALVLSFWNFGVMFSVIFIFIRISLLIQGGEMGVITNHQE